MQITGALLVQADRPLHRGATVTGGEPVGEASGRQVRGTAAGAANGAAMEMDEAAFTAWRVARRTLHDAYDRARQLVPLGAAGQLPGPENAGLTLEQRAALVDLTEAERAVRRAEQMMPQPWQTEPAH